MAYFVSPAVRTIDDVGAPSSSRWGVATAILSYASLLKPRILVLLLFVSVLTAYLAADGSPDIASLVLLLATGSMATGGAGVLNHYLERDLDGLMERTKRRPLVLGRIGKPRMVLGGGLLLIALAVAAALPFSVSLSLFLFAGAFVYVVVYTIWLK